MSPSRLLFVFCFTLLLLPTVNITGQNLSMAVLEKPEPDVCGNDVMAVVVQNAAGSPAATNVRLTIDLYTGISYVPGSVISATEFNVGNLNNPVFQLSDFPAGFRDTIFLTVTGECDLVGQINTGQELKNNLTLTHNAGSIQVTSDKCNPNTGLANLLSVVPVAVNAVRGDVITRTIKLKNTREGAIKALSYRDEHQPGISIELLGGFNQVNTATTFTADIPGSFFTAFGDGDDLLEVDDGEITLIEKVTIENCGIPSYTNISEIIVGWGCNNLTCRADSIAPQVTILPSTQNPSLHFTPEYARPLSYCASIPSEQIIRINNSGALAASDVKVDVYLFDTTFVGIDHTSFAWSYDRVNWTPAAIEFFAPTFLPACQISTYDIEVVAIVPQVPANDTVYLRYNTYACPDVCKPVYPKFRFEYLYYKVCPPTAFVTGKQNMYPDTAFLKFDSGFKFNVGHCFEDDSLYKVAYWVESKRFPIDTGVLQVQLKFPKGLELDPTCAFKLGGLNPLSFETFVDPEGTTHLNAVFDLPFSVDSLGDELCIKYNCQPGMPCLPPATGVPKPGKDFLVYAPSDDCEGCQLEIEALASINLNANIEPNCGITSCYKYTTVVNDDCNGGGPGGGGGIGGGSGDLAYTTKFEAWRVNRGFKDDANSRMFTTYDRANAPGIRLDRFIPGDTMRNRLQLAVQAGSLETVNFRWFFEILMSDFGNQTGDPILMSPLTKTGLTNLDSTQLVGGRVIYKAANGDQFTCPLDFPEARTDKHLITVAEPNISPPAVTDMVMTMFDQYGFLVDDYIAKGCFPQGLVIGTGDSLFFEMDYRICTNFWPPGGTQPPLINIRTTACDTTKTYSWKLDDFCTEKPLMQYSGFKHEAKRSAHRIEPCDISTELTPFRYYIRLARENMFPFEIRPLNRVEKLSYSLPGNVGVADAVLNHLKLQSTPMFDNDTLQAIGKGDSIEYDLHKFFEKPLDEGYDFEVSTHFDTTCGYNGTRFGRTYLNLKFANECLMMPPEFDFYHINENAYLSGSPVIEFSAPNGNVVPLADTEVQLDFTLRNSTAINATNGWIIIESDGNLSDVQLFISNPTLMPVPIVGGVYQLDSIKQYDELFFRIVANTNSCATFDVRIRYGWNCTPKYDDSPGGCGARVGIFELRPQPVELELKLIKEQSSIPMCAPSDEFIFQISNADLGVANNVQATVKLPPHIRIVPGSSRFSYPAGSPFVATPGEPDVYPGNIYQFKLPSSLQLLPVPPPGSPAVNAVQILFKVQAECDAVAHAQPIYGAEAVQPCGVGSNRLREAGKPIDINGVNSDNEAISSMSFTDPNAPIVCGSEIEITASILLNGSPANTDSINITLPYGVSYVAGSYVPGINAPAGPPKVIGGQRLQLPLPTNIGATGNLNFNFKIRYDDPADCIDRIITLQTLEKNQAPCGPSTCTVYYATSEYLLTLNAQNPQLKLKDFQLNPGGFTATLQNAGSSSAGNPVVWIYHDINANGAVDPSEPKVGEGQYNGIIAPTASAGLSGTLNVASSAYCDLLAVIPAEQNCACDDAVFPLGDEQVVVTSIALCNVQPVDVGTSDTDGTFSWLTTNGMSCTTCNMGTYTPDASVQVGDLVTLILNQQIGDCSIERRFQIQYGGDDTGLDETDRTTCRGYSVTLEAVGGAAAYNWIGPGITNANQPTQIVTPNTTSTYSVTVTFNGTNGATCTAAGSVVVNVNPTFQKEVHLHTCPGTPKELYTGFSTDKEGVYDHTFVLSTGCDSMVTYFLNVTDDLTEETKVFCPGDSVQLYDKWVKKDTMVCRDYLTADGCDSTHCQISKMVSNPMIPEQDSVIVQAGTEIQLDGPSGFNIYEWTPPTGLDCDDCEDPIAKPTETTNYVLKVTDSNSCIDTAVYRVVTCDVDKYLKNIPTAFTPNGDGANDIFRPVPNEGAEMIVSLEVYDRWGVKQYEGRGAGAGWDGRIGDKPASSDVYVYIVVAECSGVQKKKSGQITLLR